MLAFGHLNEHRRASSGKDSDSMPQLLAEHLNSSRAPDLAEICADPAISDTAIGDVVGNIGFCLIDMRLLSSD